MIAGEGTKKEIKQWEKQRAKRGFSDYDTYEINTWFIKIMPEMLEVLIERANICPEVFNQDYLKERGFDESSLTAQQREDMSTYAYNRYKETLIEMRQAFLESDESTCSLRNQYAEEYNVRLHEFYEVYGFQSEKLKGNLKTERDEESGETYYSAIKPYRFEDMSEANKRISELYREEEKRIWEHIAKNKKKALEMFTRYFDYLVY